MAHDSSVGENTVLGDHAEIGHHTIIGEGVQIGEKALVHDWCKVDTGAVVRSGACLLHNTEVGSGAVVMENARICPDVIVCSGAVVWPEQRIKAFGTVYAGGVRPQTDKQLHFEETGFYTGRGGAVFIRAKHQGNWLSGQQVDNKDVQELNAGNMTMRSIANKYYTAMLAQDRNRGLRL